MWFINYGGCNRDYMVDLRILAFGTPVLILCFLLFILFRNVRPLQKIKLFIGIYILSIVSGILSDVLLGFYPLLTAIIAGVVAPIIYCLLVFKFGKNWISKSELLAKDELKLETLKRSGQIKALLSLILLPLILVALAIGAFIVGYATCSWGCSGSDRTFSGVLLLISVVLVFLSLGALVRNIIRQVKRVKTT
jgi:hypothetical protein